MFEPVRGGTRGGQAEFKWSDVSADKDRENYLGHSINAPTGRWQKNKDVHWYSRDLGGDAAERAEEIRKIKEAEAEALSAALGFGPKSGATAVVLSSPTNPAKAAFITGKETKEGKDEKRQRKAERREAKRERKERRRLRYGHKEYGPKESDDESRRSRREHTLRSRSHSPGREYEPGHSQISRPFRRRSPSPLDRLDYKARHDRYEDVGGHRVSKPLNHHQSSNSHRS